MNAFYVYHLVDPRSGLPFYVGKGKGSRLFQHLRDVSKHRVPNGNTYLSNKIKKILSEGLTIKCIKIAENLSEKEALDTEVAEIKRYGMRGVGVLCNLTEGGDGVSGYKKTPEQIKRQADSLRQRFNDPIFLEEHRQRMKVAHSSPTARRKNSLRTRRFYRSHPEQRGKLSCIQRKLWAAGKYDNSKEWVFTSPTGEKTTIVNLQLFCREHGLQQSNMIAVHGGKRKQHKGWMA